TQATAGGPPQAGAPAGDAPSGQGNTNRQALPDGPPQTSGSGGSSGSASSGGASGAAPNGSTGAPQGRPSGSGTTGPANSRPAASVPVFSMLIGPGCGSGGLTVKGTYKDGTKGWRYGSSGWIGNGCDGDFNAMPMSGSATKADSGQYASWLFSTGSVKSGTCTVYVYVPSSKDITMVGGNPAHYAVRGSSSSDHLGYFKIDQAANPGRWVNGGTYNIATPRLEVFLDNRGVDWGSGNTNRHIAVGQVKVDCKGR
ncbi:hypothetical protein O3W51_42350, partial [Streptomyces sp. H39-C1]|nr:hypothetical protein [Streptomyces sp. H39-C1]